METMEPTPKEPPKQPPAPQKTIVKHMTHSDRMNEPPPQPRVRKVTTVTNTLAIVVSTGEKEIGVWVLTMCQKQTIPMTQPHLFVNLKVGTWMTVGIYPDGTLASFSPWSFLLQAYPTAITNQIAYVERNAAEFRFDQAVPFKEMCEEMNVPCDRSYYDKFMHVYKISGFGLVLAHPSFDKFLEENIQNGTDGKVWIQWCGDVSRKFCWTVNSFLLRNPIDNELPDEMLREFADFIRNRKVDSEFPETTEEVVVRHFGFITDVNVDKKTVCCWSPRVSMDADHTARIPRPPKYWEADGPMLPPIVGQWIQFDIDYKDMEKFMSSETGNRLTIPEYLPITSPAGVAVAQVNRVVRMIISCILVKGTDNPYLFELPHFGLVIDRRAQMISGTHVQVVLEKTSSRVRKASGVCWTVENFMVVQPDDINVENLYELSVEYVPTRDAMEISQFMNTEKFSPTSTTSSSSKSASNNGVPTLKYQQPAHYPNYPSSRQDYYSGPNIHLPGAVPTYTGELLEGNAIVEKVNGPHSVILWVFEKHNSCHTTLSGKDFSLATGDYVYVKLIQKPDSAKQSGFSWFLVSVMKQTAPFHIAVSQKTGTVMIQDILEFKQTDKLGRTVFTSNLLPKVIDVDGLVPRSAKNVLAMVARRKIEHHMRETFTFQWTIHSVLQNSHTHYNNSHSAGPFDTIRTPPLSDRSSTSPPLPRDERIF